DMMWNVKKADIEVFKADNSKATSAIKTWPAHGNTALGEAKYLAPFVDVDKDGVYDYTKGDYPKIKGDQAIWWIFNDALGEHTESGSDPMGLEIHAMAYAFASEDSTLNNTLFFEYDIINRSKNNYKDMLLGIWTDFDLGYPMDDAIGCDSAQSAYFCYNADPFDEGVMGYGSKIPVQSVVFLQDSLKYFMTYNNEESNMGTPMGKDEHYNYMRSQMRNGDKLINPTTNKSTKYAYSGNPVNKTGWVMGKTEVDKRGLGSTGPLTLAANQKHTFNFAYITSFKTNGSINDNLTTMYSDVAKVKSYYNNEILSAPENSHSAKLNMYFSAYPNPANDLLNLQWNNSSAENVRIMNMLGQTIWSEKISAGENKISIDTKHFPRGIYMAVIENGSQKAVKRVVLQ
ncbi:MAG: T9SS type A sorting domain-containing protein, partial [Bacteroidia bacterium]